jgi:type I restriction enzyme S subunit
MNRTLEALGKAMFKHSFVDFEFPNEAGKPHKSSGGKMVFNGELGKEIPRGWNVAKLAGSVNVIKGCSYRSHDLQASDVALVTLKSIDRGGGFNQEGYKEFTGEYNQNQVLKDGDIVVAQTDLTQRAEVVGRPALVNSSGKYSELVASLDLQIVRPKNGLSKHFVYFLLKTEEFHDHALSYTNGTTVLHLDKNAIPEFKFVIPGREALERFDRVIGPLLTKAGANQTLIECLALLRDSILPRLISGKIRVPVEVG